MIIGQDYYSLILQIRKQKLGNLPKAPQEVSYRVGIKAQIALFLTPDCLLNFTQMGMGPLEWSCYFRSVWGLACPQKGCSQAETDSLLSYSK